MKKFTTLSSLLVLGTVGYFVKMYLSPEDIQLNFAEEEIHLYL